MTRTPVGLIRMTQTLGVKPEGKVHSGIDDARNIARITLALLHDGAIVDITSQVSPTRTELPSPPMYS